MALKFVCACVCVYLKIWRVRNTHVTLELSIDKRRSIARAWALVTRRRLSSLTRTTKSPTWTWPSLAMASFSVTDRTIHPLIPPSTASTIKPARTKYDSYFYLKRSQQFSSICTILSEMTRIPIPAEYKTVNIYQCIEDCQLGDTVLS